LPILPIVDLLILLGSGSLMIGFVLKAITLATIYRPHIMGFTSLDFVLIAGVCLSLALVLVARTWLKLNEPTLLALQSRLRHEQARQRAIDLEQEYHGAQAAAAPGPEPADRVTAQR
jgi:hypothetical protein